MYGNMFLGGRGMGGSGATGSSSNMLRLVGRTVTARASGVTNLQEPITSPTSPTATSKSTHKFTSCNNNNNNRHLSLSSCSGSSFLSATTNSSNYWDSHLSYGEDCEWVSVDGSEDETCINEDFFLGPVPSIDEVHSAVSALTQVFDSSYFSGSVHGKFPDNTDAADLISSPTRLLHDVSSVGAELDWVEPSPHLFNTRVVDAYGPDRVYDAFHLLQTEPSIQVPIVKSVIYKRMVISLSSDQAVWDAVLNNEAVQELRRAYHADGSLSPPSLQSSDDESDDRYNPAWAVIIWIFNNATAKLMEALDKLIKLATVLFKPSTNEMATAGAATDPFDEKLRTSFLLSIVVLLIVVVARAQKA